MNEDELKKIWQADNHAPTIDFAGLQQTLSAWRNKLRRKIRIDIGAQIVSLVILLLTTLFYPKFVFVFSLMAAIVVWYLWELLKFYRQEERLKDYLSVRQFLSEKSLTMKSFIRRARLVSYIAPFVLIPAVYYGLGFFETSSTARSGINWLIYTLLAVEITVVVLTEIYFKIFYASAVSELESLLRQLDSAE